MREGKRRRAPDAQGKFRALERHRPVPNLQGLSEIHVEVHAARRSSFGGVAIQLPDLQGPGGGSPVQHAAPHEPVLVGKEEVLEREGRFFDGLVHEMLGMGTPPAPRDLPDGLRHTPPFSVGGEVAGTGEGRLQRARRVPTPGCPQIRSVGPSPLEGPLEWRHDRASLPARKCSHTSGAGHGPQLWAYRPGSDVVHRGRFSWAACSGCPWVLR